MSQYSRHPQSFSVDWQFDLLTTHDAFAPGNDTLAEILTPPPGRPARALVFIDAGIEQAQPDLGRRIARWFSARNGDRLQLAASPVTVPGGEAAKRDWSIVELVGQMCAEYKVCRHSYIIVIGGGAVLDAVGLGAALVHRGVRLVRMPTTVLAQDDAGLGVKNGINGHGSKNYFGTFAPPYAIINDSRFLLDLSDRDWRAGCAEAIKVALIKDAAFLSWLLGHADRLAARDLATMEQMIERCALLHLDHITGAGDPFETGSSRPLDFGHWSAHRMEILSQHRLNHGEAVAIGIAIDLLYASRQGLIDGPTVDAVFEAFTTLGFFLWDETLDLRESDGRRSVLTGIEQFREHLGGELCLAMPKGAGNRIDIHDLDEAVFEACIRDLRRRGRISQRLRQA